MRKYTVVLTRFVDLGEADMYVTHVEAAGHAEATELAQLHEFEQDLDRPCVPPQGPSDYKFVAIFLGHHKPLICGWPE